MTPTTFNKIGAFSEIVGRVSKFGNDSLTLTSTIRLPVGQNQMARWKHLLHRGSYVAILLLDNGEIRARSISKVQRVNRTIQKSRGRRKAQH